MRAEDNVPKALAVPLRGQLIPVLKNLPLRNSEGLQGRWVTRGADISLPERHS